MTKAIAVWNDPKQVAEIKEQYGKNLNDTEWKFFLALGQATGLNPFLREIWAVKYGNNPASTFIGRDGYRRSAQAHPLYEYHYVDAVYSKDTFEIVNGEVVHKFNLADRGLLLGAYCVVKRKGATRPAFNFVELKEYVQKFGVWTTKPATMIKKVAEAQGLRGAFQELFAGTYEESEQWKEDKQNAVDATQPEPPAPREPSTGFVPAADVAKDRPYVPPAANKPEVVDAQIVDVPPAPAAPQPTGNGNAMPPAPPRAPEDQIPPGKIRVDQTKKMFAVWAEYMKAAGHDPKKSIELRKEKMLKFYAKDSSAKLNEVEADDFISKIEKETKLLTGAKNQANAADAEYAASEDAGRAMNDGDALAGHTCGECKQHYDEAHPCKCGYRTLADELKVDAAEAGVSTEPIL